MKNYGDITLKYLKKNRKRTIFTVIGIVLSLSLISGIGFLGLSFNDFMYERAITNNGDYEFYVRGLNSEQINILKNDVDLEKVAVTGKSTMYSYDDRKSENKITIDIIEEDDTSFKDVYYKALEEGRFPENQDEIILGKSSKDFLDINIGDTIELNEEIYDEVEGEYVKGETKLFTVVGFSKDNIISDGTYFSGSTLLESLKEDESYSTLFTVVDNKNKVSIATEKINNFIGEDGEISMFANNELLALKGESTYRGINDVIKYIIVFVLAVIIFATIFLIYNAINISVTERMSQFAILRSIGASPNQIKNIVLREGLIMCLLAVPFGVLFGYLGVWITVKILQTYITSMLGDRIFTVKFYPIVIIFTTVLGVITILIASFGPAKKAGKISPISIIKGNTTEEKVKYYNGKLVRKIFGVEGWIAYKNIRKNSRRFIVTILSLSISLIMFIIFTTLNMKRIDELNYLNKSTLDQGTLYVYEQEFTDILEEKLKKIDGIDEVYGWFENSFPIVLDSNIITEEFKSIYGSRYSYVESEEYIEKVRVNTFNDEVLKHIGIEEGLRDNEIILVNNITMYDNLGRLSKIDITNLKEGDTIKIPATCINCITSIENMEDEGLINSINKDIENDNYYEFKVKKIIDKNPFDQGYSYSLQMIVSKEFMKPFRKDVFIGSDKLGFKYKDINDEVEVRRIAEEVSKLAEEYECSFMDNSEYNRRSEEMWTVINVFVYGFIVMISLIGIVNVINTISLNILLKKKEFGTLGTIGMDRKQLYKMVILEGVLHGIIASIIGGIIAVSLTLLAVRIVSFGFTFGYKLYWQPFFIGFVVNIVVTIIASLIPLNKLKKMSLLETVRNIE